MEWLIETALKLAALSAAAFLVAGMLCSTVALIVFFANSIRPKR